MWAQCLCHFLYFIMHYALWAYLLYIYWGSYCTGCCWCSDWTANLNQCHDEMSCQCKVLSECPRALDGYTSPLVDTCARCWKVIVLNSVPASEFTTCLAWYSRMLRMRRGPNTNNCMNLAIEAMPTKLAEFYINVRNCQRRISIIDLHTLTFGDTNALKVRQEAAAYLARKEHHQQK